MKTTYRITLLVISLLLVISITIGTSYSLWKKVEVQKEQNIVESSCFSIEFSESSNINLKNAMPISDASGLKKTPYTFTIKNTCNADTKIKISLNVLNSSTMDSSIIKFSMKYGSLANSTPALLNTFNKGESSTNVKESYLVKEDIIRGNEEKTYSIYLWMDESAGNEYMNKVFNAKVSVTSEATKYTLYSKIKDDYESGIDSIAKYNDSENVYYYMGNVTNNNVIFNDFCWKIVRTTDTQGVKIIYNGKSNNSECKNTGTDTEIGTSNWEWYNAGYMYNKRYYSKRIDTNDNYIFGNDVSYENNKYILIDTQSGFDSTHHYTCLSTTSSECETVSYAYYRGITGYSTNEQIWYWNLNNGEKIEDVLNNMILNDDVNQNDSLIKLTVDKWFEENMISKVNMLEDTIWCNNRTILNYESSGYNPNSNSINNATWLNYNDKKSLECENKRDSFTVDSNIGNGKLTYPVGLIDISEANLSIKDNDTYLNTGSTFYTMSPAYITYDSPHFYYISSQGVLESGVVAYVDYGIRPMVSLKSNVVLSTGDGTSSNPYQLRLN